MPPSSPREIGEEDDAGFERADEDRLATVVVARDLGTELADTRSQFPAAEIDLADSGVVTGYDAIGSLNRSASRATSRL